MSNLGKLLINLLFDPNQSIRLIRRIAKRVCLFAFCLKLCDICKQHELFSGCAFGKVSVIETPSLL